MRFVYIFCYFLVLSNTLQGQNSGLRVKVLPFYYPEKTIHGQEKQLIFLFAVERDISAKWGVQMGYGIIKGNFSSPEFGQHYDNTTRLYAIEILRYIGRKKHMRSWFTAFHFDRVIDEKQTFFASGRNFTFDKRTNGLGLSLGKNFKIAKGFYFQTSLGAGKGWSRDYNGPSALYTSEVYRNLRKKGFYPRGYFLFGFEF
jgi:hypothetical protein